MQFDPARTRLIQTPRGEVRAVRDLTTAELEGLELDPGIGVFARYRSLITSKDTLNKVARDPLGSVCAIIGPKGRIVAYCLRRTPEPGERWARMDPPIMLEIMGETARGWRDQGLMKPLTAMVCHYPEVEDHILYIVGYSWTWDLDGTQKSVLEYRDTLIHLMTPLGFKQYPTNEPNVGLRPENLFMARLGANLTPEVKKRFTNLLFGIQED